MGEKRYEDMNVPRVSIGGSGLLILPPDPGRKSSNLIGIFHKGGGWYKALCFGGAKKCKAGECRHVAGLGMRNAASGKVRAVHPEARDA